MQSHKECICFDPEETALFGYRPEEKPFDHCSHPHCRERKESERRLKEKWDQMRVIADERERHRREMELEADAIRDELSRRKRETEFMADKHREFEEAFDIATKELISRRREEERALSGLMIMRSNADAAEGVIQKIKACHASETPGCHYCHT